MASDQFTPERARHFMTVIKNSACPFIKVTAERAGLPYSWVQNWLVRGDRDIAFGDTETPLAVFAADVRRVQGVWKDAAMKRIAGAGKDTRDAAQNERWLLERLDRETFDMSRLPKNAPKGETDKPKPPADLKQAIADLENPEPVLQ